MATETTTSLSDSGDSLGNAPENVQSVQNALLPAESNVGTLGSADLLDLQSLLLRHDRFTTAAAALCNTLSRRLACSRVSLGLRRHQVTRLMAVSNSVAKRHEGEEFLAIATAMDEAVDQHASLSLPIDPGAQPHITLAHAELARRTGGACLLTLPLAAAGAITLERPAGKPFSPEETRQLEQLVSLTGPLLLLKWEVDRPLPQRLGDVLGAFWGKLRGPGHTTLKVSVAGALGALLLLAFLPVDYRIAAPIRLEGEVQRVLAAPDNGFIQKVHVRPGDSVQAGQVLVELAREDLMLELRRWQSELARHNNGYAAAMSSGDRAQLAVSLSQMQEAQAQIELVQGQLQRAQLHAPFAGVVISGDLSQSLGAPVQRGNVSLTVAPGAGRRLILEVDEQDITHVQPGQTGEFAVKALPGRSFDFKVARISPVAGNRDGRNFFEVEAGIPNAAVELRPGLEGVAKIDVGSRSPAWIVSHRAINWLRLTLWRWLG